MRNLRDHCQDLYPVSWVKKAERDEEPTPAIEEKEKPAQGRGRGLRAGGRAGNFQFDQTEKAARAGLPLLSGLVG